MKLPLLFLSISICLSLSAFSQSEIKYSKVKINILKSDIVKLQANGLDFDHGHYSEEEKTFTVSLPADGIDILNRLPYRYKVLVADEKAEFLRKNKPEEFFKYANDPVITANRFVYDAPSGQIGNNFTTPSAFTSGSMGGYYTLSEMITKLNNMKSTYSSLVRIDTIGYTWQSRPILAVKISSNVNVNSGKPEVLYTGLHHAREPMGMMNLIFFMQYLLENYSSSTMIQELVNNRSLYFIPCVNPDGYQYNCANDPTGGGMHRKNRRNTGGSNPGVDLNRNYGFGFGYANGGSSTSTGADNYRGPSGFSEPETQAMRDYINAREFKFALNYHAYGEYWINSYCVPTGTLTALDSKIVETTGHLMTRTNFYLVGTPIQTVGYNANGSSDDWFMGGDPANHDKLYCFSPEIGSDTYDFWPTSSQIIPIAKEVMFANFQAAYIGGSYAKVEDKSPLAVSSTTGNFDFTLRRYGLTGADVTVSIVPLQNIQTVGSPITISTLSNPLDTVNRSISYTLSPGIQMGQKIRFLWKVETGGISLVDTITKLYNPTVLVTDNMEGTIGNTWNVTGTWAYSTTNAFTGSKSLGTTSSGNYGNNVSGNTATLKNVLDLTNSTSAYASFWVRYRLQTGYDKVRIQVAGNGNGAGATWVTLPSSYTIAENKGTIGGIPSITGVQDYWVRETVDLSAYTGNSNVGFRFIFQSNNDGLVESGMFVDDLQVMRSGSSTLPVSFLSIKAIANKNDITVLWKAQTNDQHDHFEIERSADGSSFAMIGKVFGTGYDFSLIDSDPLAGTNYYRVRGVDKDGKYNYTPVVSAKFIKPTTIRIYPNPVHNHLQVSFNNSITARYTIEIISQSGQAVWRSFKTIQEGMQVFDIPAENLTAGMYLLKISNDNETIIKESFIKAIK